MNKAFLSIATSLLIASSASAQNPVYEDRMLMQGSDLADWCYRQAVATYTRRGYYTYQWTVSHGSNGQDLYANGKLRVHHEDVPISCSARSQTWESEARISIDDPQLDRRDAKPDFQPLS